MRSCRRLRMWTFLGAMPIASAAHAAAPSLRYEIPTAPATDGDACPSVAELRDALAARLGYDPFAEADGPSASVRVEHTSAGFSGRLRLIPRDGAPSERRLVAARCDELVRALAVTLSVMLDPLGEHSVKEPPDRPRAPESVPAPVLAAVAVAVPAIGSAGPSQPRAPESATTPQREGVPLRFDVEAGAVGSAGLLPDVGLGGRIALGVHRAPWSIHLEGRFDRVLGESEIAQNQRASVALLGGGISGCYEASPVFGCVLTTAAAYQARGSFVTAPSTESGLWLAATLRFGAALRLAPSVWLVPHVDGIVPILKKDLEVDNGQVLWEAPPVAVAFGLAVRTRFP